MPDRFETLRTKLEAAILGTRGDSTAAERRNAMSGEGKTPALTAFLGRVQRHAYRVTDEEVEALKAEGHSEDRLFELIGAAALGSALHRLRAGLRALEGGKS